jgi:hypothetical protein
MVLRRRDMVDSDPLAKTTFQKNFGFVSIDSTLGDATIV